MPTYVNNDVASGAVVYASDHNTMGALIAAILNGSIDATNLADGAATTPKIADLSVTNAKLSTTTGEIGAAWQSWTPTFANFVTGNGTVVAKYVKVGKVVRYRISIVLGSTSIVGTAPTFTLPVTAAAYAGTATIPPIGEGELFDSGNAVYKAAVLFNSTTTGLIQAFSASGTYVSNASITLSVPFTWGTSDEMCLAGTYEAA